MFANKSNLESMEPLKGGRLWFAAFLIASANFMSVLDMTIANVSIPTISGSLGVTVNQGTWVISSYAVAEAIIVPLTGWLAARFGAVRAFIWAMGLFGLTSAFCGLATSLEMLVFARTLQGIAGGPLMPLSQTLLLRIFPPEKAGLAIMIWAMTTLIAPIVGPILGGVLCDNLSWPWIFYINFPLVLLGCFFGAKLLGRYELSLKRVPMDVVGLCLLVIWVGSLQLMLDLGKDLDWFASTEIVTLSLVALVGFAVFLIWELTHEHPIVNLRVFRHRGFAVAVLTMSMGYACFFALNVLTPLWLQTNMLYTPSQSGYTTAWTALFSICMAPLVTKFANRVDRRRLISAGALWLALVTGLRMFSNTDMTYWDIAFPIMIMGLGMPMFFISSTGLALGSVSPEETASAAGLVSFFRAVSAAFAVSTVTTVWDHRAVAHHAENVALLDADNIMVSRLLAQGMDREAALTYLGELLQRQSVMLATNEIMLFVALMFMVTAGVIWLAPRLKVKTPAVPPK
jgi:MFS transporter, DHA2 family, multidrug resistance protein